MTIHLSTLKAKEKYEGKIYPTKRFGDIEIVEYSNNRKVLIKFVDSGYETFVQLSSIVSGYVKDHTRPTECGVGIVDVEGASVGRVPIPEYKLWCGMLSRCYNPKAQAKLPTYKFCQVSENFKTFSKFKAWCEQQTGYGKKGWHLDKDILVKGNKVYSEDTCCFLPKEINCLMTNNKSVRGDLPQGVIWNCTKTRYRARIQKTTGWESLGTYDTPEQAFQAYKVAKEAYIKEVAEKWKDQIDPRVYQALLNWKIEITD